MHLPEILLADDLLLGNRPDIDRLQMVYLQHWQSSGFAKRVLLAIAHLETEIAASWLLKYHLERQQQLNGQQTDVLLRLLSSTQSWQARLHLLQSFRFLKIPATTKHQAEAFIRKNLADTNKFTRAWAYDSFYRLAKQHSEYMHEAKQLLQLGLVDEPASVTARIRSLLAKIK